MSEPEPTPTEQTTHEHGFALLLVLWLLVLLGVEVALLSNSASDATRLIANETAIIRGESLARSAMEVAAARLLSADDRERWAASSARYRVPFPEANVTVRISDENGKINLNLADASMISRLIQVVTGSSREAEAATARLQAWRQQGRSAERTATPTGGGAAPAPPSNAPSNAPGAWSTFASGQRRAPLLADAADFAKVTGLSQQTMAALLPHVTIFTSEGRINPSYASNEVLRALPNVTEANLGQILKLRAGGPTDGEQLNTLLRDARGYISNRRGPAYRLDIGMPPDSQRAIGRAVAVIQLSLDAEAPFRLLSWHFEPANVPEAADQGAIRPASATTRR